MRAVVGAALVSLLGLTLAADSTCDKGEARTTRYLLYDVNPGEGFNLRRDVYVRVANLVRALNDHDTWVLVLPPWGRLYHWKNMDYQSVWPWKNFFDVPSLNRWIPVMEFEDYVKGEGRQVEQVYLLQHYAEGWTGKWEEKFDEKPCIDPHTFKPGEDGAWHGRAWGDNIKANKFSCISIQGQASKVKEILAQNPQARSVLIKRAETVLHDDYGGRWYWSARRSMRFAHHLLEEARRFRRDHLESVDDADYTEVAQDWRDSKPKRGAAIGGPYLGVHLRRQDFLRARESEVPSLKSAAKQIKKLMKKHGLNKVFIATDAPTSEYEQLKSHFSPGEVFCYEPSKEFFKQWGDGGVAIVDQIISAHARYFIGSYESTFSFRIQEEREILGFGVESTFNRLCGKKQECEQPAQWKIVY